MFGSGPYLSEKASRRFSVLDKDGVCWSRWSSVPYSYMLVTLEYLKQVNPATDGAMVLVDSLSIRSLKIITRT